MSLEARHAPDLFRSYTKTFTTFNTSVAGAYTAAGVLVVLNLDPAYEVLVACRFPEHYPHKPVHVQLTEVAGLRQADVEELQKLLEAKAYEYADSGMVAVHNLATDCSDWLRTATRSDGNEQVCCVGYGHPFGASDMLSKYGLRDISGRIKYEAVAVICFMREVHEGTVCTGTWPVHSDAAVRHP